MPSQISAIGHLPRRSTITASGRTPKVPKACEECRRRKQKCDGRSPCRICTKRQASCSYHVPCSSRGAKASSAPYSGVTPSNQNVASPRASQAIPLRVHIFNNIRATNDASGTELFYGASSNFSLLHHLNIHLPSQTLLAPHPEVIANGARDGGESIERYGYQSLVFDSLVPPVQRVADYSLIGYDLAKAYLRNFLLTASHRTPFLEPVGLCSALETLYTPGDHHSLQPSDRSILIIALAIGATPSTDSPHRQHLIAQARAEAASTLYDISLKAVQIAVLMAQCEFDACNSNLCYLQLGGAIRKAFAAGVHRASSLEAKHTMWTMFCNESLICFMLGRQSLLKEEDIVASSIETQSYIGSLVRLCIIIRSAYGIYRSDNTSVVADLDLAHSINRQLCEFSSTLRVDLALNIGGQLYALSGEKLSWHITISYLYHFTTLLVYRPFFLLCLELKRRSVSEGRRSTSNVETAELAEASLACIRSAQSIVALSDSLFSLQIGLEGSYNHGFYLESACFVLVLAAVYVDGILNDDLKWVRKGIELMQKLSQREPIQSIVSALEQMLGRVNTVPAEVPPSHEHGATAAHEGRPLHPATSLPDHSTHAPSAIVNDSASSSNSQIFTSNDGDVLEELWSMIDWSVDFPSLDPGFSVPTRGT